MAVEFFQAQLLQDRQVAALLGICRATVWNLVKAGKLTPVRLTPRCTRFKSNDVAALLQAD